MCLAVPGKVLEIEGDRAKVDYGGVIRDANVSLVPAKVGDYVVVHAGFAIEIMDEEEAKQVIELWDEYFEFIGIENA